jgi:hypothetical protein
VHQYDHLVVDPSLTPVSEAGPSPPGRFSDLIWGQDDAGLLRQLPDCRLAERLARVDAPTRQLPPRAQLWVGRIPGVEEQHLISDVENNGSHHVPLHGVHESQLSRRGLAADLPARRRVRSSRSLRRRPPSGMSVRVALPAAEGLPLQYYPPMPDRQGETWTLHSHDRLLAELVVTGSDFPWLYARVEPHDGWSAVQPLFAEELRGLDQIDDETASWEAAYDAVREAVVLRYPDGKEVPEFLLHVDGHEAWWRWAGGPFED